MVSGGDYFAEEDVGSGVGDAESLLLMVAILRVMVFCGGDIGVIVLIARKIRVIVMVVT